MTRQWESVLKDVISEVLETMFFSLVEFEEGDSGQNSFEYESRVCLFNQAGRMEISLSVSGGFAKMLTANFLGINEDQVGEEDIQDSLRELTNMVGGGYHVRAETTDYELGIPKAWRVVDGERTQGVKEETAVYFGCLGKPVGSALLQFVPDGTCS
jgi:CheY-specific phosphatase CheX